MWILGHRTSEAYRVTENTERVLEVSVRFEEWGSYCGESKLDDIQGRH